MLPAWRTQVRPDAHAVLICDGAGWHQRGKRLKVPANITLIRLPPYSPELNSMENVMQIFDSAVLHFKIGVFQLGV